MTESALTPALTPHGAAVRALRPVATRPYLRQDAADEIRRFVVDGALRPGDQLPSERELCERLGLSRTSVREALRLLEQEGLVEVRQGRRPVVRPFDLMPVIQPALRRLAAERHLLRDLLDARAPLEVLAARTAARRRTEQDLAAMRDCLDRMRRALDSGADTDTTLDEDVLFHELLFQAAGNKVLLAFSRAVRGLLRAVRETAASMPPAVLDLEGEGVRPGHLSLRDHTAIFERVAARDEDGAATVMQRHMDAVRRQHEAAERFFDELDGAARDTSRPGAEDGAR